MYCIKEENSLLCTCDGLDHGVAIVLFCGMAKYGLGDHFTFAIIRSVWYNASFNSKKSSLVIIYSGDEKKSLSLFCIYLRFPSFPHFFVRICFHFVLHLLSTCTILIHTLSNALQTLHHTTTHLCILYSLSHHCCTPSKPSPHK